MTTRRSATPATLIAPSVVVFPSGSTGPLRRLPSGAIQLRLTGLLDWPGVALEELTDAGSRLLLHVVEDVLVGVGGDLNRGVTEPLREHLLVVGDTIQPLFRYATVRHHQIVASSGSDR